MFKLKVIDGATRATIKMEMLMAMKMCSGDAKLKLLKSYEAKLGEQNFAGQFWQELFEEVIVEIKRDLGRD